MALDTSEDQLQSRQWRSKSAAIAVASPAAARLTSTTSSSGVPVSAAIGCGPQGGRVVATAVHDAVDEEGRRAHHLA